MDYLHIIFKVLLIAGALNWGSIALGGPDMVMMLASYLGIPELDQYIKLLVGLAGLYGVYELYAASQASSPKAYTDFGLPN